MEQKVLRLVTIGVMMLTMLMSASFLFLPDMHARAVQVLEKSENSEVVEVQLPNTEAEDLSGIVEEGAKGQLEIQLPDGVTENNLEITNDYLTQTIYIRWPNGEMDYASSHTIRGSSDHIASLSYYRSRGDGVLMLGLDHVYEIEPEIKEGFLYLSFIDPHKLYDKVVVIDAGHGGRQPGAVENGVSEKELDLAILLKLKAILDASPENIRVYYTRTTDVNPSFSQRVELANKSDADLFLSIHNNSNVSGKMTNLNGTLVMYSQSQEESQSKRFAQICLDKLVSTLGSKNKGLAGGDDHAYIIRNSKVPMALVEIGFMTNEQELEKLCSEEYQQLAAEALYEAILQAFEEGF